jgi:hypothetical protein
VNWENKENKITGSTKQQQQGVKFALPPGLTGYLPQLMNQSEKIQLFGAFGGLTTASPSSTTVPS